MLCSSWLLLGHGVGRLEEPLSYGERALRATGPGLTGTGTGLG